MYLFAFGPSAVYEDASIAESVAALLLMIFAHCGTTAWRCAAGQST